MIFAGKSHLENQLSVEKMSSDHTIAFMHGYETLRRENYNSLIRRNKLEEFEQQMEKTRAAVLKVFDTGKTIHMLEALALGLLALGGLFLVSLPGVCMGFAWGRPLAFWSVAAFGAGYAGYAGYSIYHGYRAVKNALQHHYSLMAVADPGSVQGNTGAEALWSMILNFSSAPSIVLHIFAAGVIIWLLGELR